MLWLVGGLLLILLGTLSPFNFTPLSVSKRDALRSFFSTQAIGLISTEIFYCFPLRIWVRERAEEPRNASVGEARNRGGVEFWVDGDRGSAATLSAPKSE